MIIKLMDNLSKTMKWILEKDGTYREFERRGRRRKKDMEIHRTSKSWAIVFVSLVVTSKHLGNADFCWLEFHFLLQQQG